MKRNRNPDEMKVTAVEFHYTVDAKIKEIAKLLQTSKSELIRECLRVGLPIIIAKEATAGSIELNELTELATLADIADYQPEFKVQKSDALHGTEMFPETATKTESEARTHGLRSR